MLNVLSPAVVAVAVVDPAVTSRSRLSNDIDMPLLVASDAATLSTCAPDRCWLSSGVLIRSECEASTIGDSWLTSAGCEVTEADTTRSGNVNETGTHL